MNFSDYQGPMDYPQGPPMGVGQYNSSMDKTRIFWITTLITITISLIFIFGYWFGDRKSSQIEFTPSDSVDLSDSIQQQPGQNIQLPSNMVAPPPIPNNNIPVPPPTYLDQSLSKNNNIITDQELSMLDNATLTNANPTTPSLPEIQNLPQVPKNKIVIKPQKAANAPYYYTIQIATLRSEAGALRLKKEMKQRGYSNTTVLKKGVLYRVRYGQFSSYSEAVKAAPTVKEKAKVQSILVLKINR